MGSFDATCVLTDIGISSGDRIACLLLQEGNYGTEPNRNWNPVSPFLMGTYDDYGRVALDEEPEACLAHIKPWVVPVEAGVNSYHEPAINPDDLSWDLVEDADHEDRLFLYARDKDVPAFIAATAAKNAKHDESLAKMQEVDPDDLRGPFWRIRKTLGAAGIQTQDNFQTGSCYLHSINTTGLFALDFPWDTKLGNPIITQVREALLPIGYSAHVIPASGIAYKDGTPPEDYQVSLLIAPSPSTTIHLNFRSELDTVARVRVKRGFIRLDVLDVLFPVNERMIKRAGQLKNLHAAHKDGDTLYQRLGMGAYGFANAMKQMGSRKYTDSDGLWFASESSTADVNHIAPQILAMPLDSPVEAYIPWVRLANVISTAKWWMRRGLRPTTQYVGSQCAPDDWEAQLKYHRAISKLLAPMVKEMKAERRRLE